MSIQIFAGEFMRHPAAISIEFNHCSHNCVYCYAHTRGSGRRCELQSVINRLNRLKYGKPKVLLDWLLYYKYPICISNWTDPFSDNNYESMLALSHHFATIDNGLFIQTKGGKGIKEFIANLGNKKNVIWYITLTTPHDDISGKLEPKAPRSSERIALIKELRKMGYTVVVGLNPLYEKWLPFEDFKLLVDDLISCGVKHYWLQNLHINKKEYSEYSDERKAQLHSISPIEDTPAGHKEFIKYLTSDECIAYGDKADEYLRENGCYTSWGTFYDRFNYFVDTLGDELTDGKPYYSATAFLNHILSKNADEYPYVLFDEYDEFMRAVNPDLYEKEMKGIPNNFAIRHAFNSWNNNPEIQEIMTFRELFSAIWNYEEFMNCPANNALFSYDEFLYDENGHRILLRNDSKYSFEEILDIMKKDGVNHIDFIYMLDEELEKLSIDF